MNDPLPEDALQRELQATVDKLLQKHFLDPQTPAAAEVRDLVAGLALRQRELEDENQDLRKTQKTLEAYRDRYTDLYDFAPLGYVTLDEDGFIQEINLSGARLLRSDREALTGYSLHDYVARDDREAFLDHVRKCVREHCEVTTELTLVDKQGRSIEVQLHTIPLDEPKTGAVLTKTAITDISAHKQMAETLEKERKLLRTLIDHLPDAIYIKDLEHRFFVVNAAVASIMGTVPEELLGKTDDAFYAPQLADEYRRDEEQVLRSGEPLLDKLEPHPDAEGNQRAVLTTKLPLRNGHGKVVGLVGISRDITAIKRSEAAVARLTAVVESLGGAHSANRQILEEILKGWALERQAYAARVGRP